MKRSIPVFAICALLLAGASPAAHADGVTVNFGISVVHNLPTGAACPVTVEAGSNGGAVLAAALSKGCILEYTVAQDPQFGSLVQSIDFVPNLPQYPDPSWGLVAFWCMTRNGASTDYGLDGYAAADGDQLVFVYTNFAVFLTPLGC